MRIAAFLTSVALGIDNLRANPLRTLLSTLGVVVGVAALVAVLALGDGMERYGTEQIRDEGLHVVTVSPVEATEVDGVRIARDSFPVLTTRHAAELVGVLPPDVRIGAQIGGAALVTAPGGGPAHGTAVVGLLPVDDVLPFELVGGRMFTDDDARAGAAVVLLSVDLARALAAPDSLEALIGSAVTFAGDSRREVIGIVRPRRGVARPGQPAHLAVMPVDGAAEVMAPAGRRRSPRLLVHAASVEQVPAVRETVERWAAQRWAADWKTEVSVSSTSAGRLEQVRTATRIFKLFMGAITGISLLVGGIGIMNVLLASVTERTREIGIRKTTGARNRDILRQFLAESVVVTGAGSVVGAALGLAGAFAATAVMRMQTGAEIHAAVSIRTLLLTAGIALVIGLAFGTYPARRAARLSPIDAIRHE